MRLAIESRSPSRMLFYMGANSIAAQPNNCSFLTSLSSVFIVRATPADRRTARAALSAAVHRKQSILRRRETMEPLLAVELDDRRVPRRSTTADDVTLESAPDPFSVPSNTHTKFLRVASIHPPRGSSGRVTRKAVLRRAWHDRCRRGIPYRRSCLWGCKGTAPCRGCRGRAHASSISEAFCLRDASSPW